MTRRAMLAQVRANLLLDESSPLWTGDAEQHALDSAADDTAQATDCYFAEQVDDLVAGKSRYCFPKIYKVKHIYLADATGKRTELSRVSLKHMNRCYPGWQSWTSADRTRTDKVAVLFSFAEFAIAAPAATTLTDALIVAGFALPSLPAAGHDGASGLVSGHQWDTDSDECPLPAWAHNAVVLKATTIRARQLAAREPSFLRLAQEYEQQWRIACGEIAAQATTLYQG